MKVANCLKVGLVTLMLAMCKPSFGQADVNYEEGWVDNEGVKIHYMTKGTGQPLIFLHGFPDFWYSWKQVMDLLPLGYQVIAIDLRGYNKSDKPKGIENYKMSVLMSDVVAVIKHFSSDGAILVANDWGGAIAWHVSMYYPGLVSGMIACNIPHPSSLSSYLQKNPSTSNYTDKYTASGAENNFTPADLARMVVKDENEFELYEEAMSNSDFEALFNYYRANYPKPGSSGTAKRQNPIRIKCPVLVIHGLADAAFPPESINDTWLWIDNKVTIQTLPGVGHFVQKEKPREVSNHIQAWINQIEGYKK